MHFAFLSQVFVLGELHGLVAKNFQRCSKIWFRTRILTYIPLMHRRPTGSFSMAETSVYPSRHWQSYPSSRSVHLAKGEQSLDEELAHSLTAAREGLISHPDLIRVLRCSLRKMHLRPGSFAFGEMSFMPTLHWHVNPKSVGMHSPLIASQSTVGLWHASIFRQKPPSNCVVSPGHWQIAVFSSISEHDMPFGHEFLVAFGSHFVGFSPGFAGLIGAQFRPGKVITFGETSTKPVLHLQVYPTLEL